MGKDYRNLTLLGKKVIKILHFCCKLFPKLGIIALGDEIMAIKPIIWIASTKSDLISLPDEVQDEIGHALYQAQKGEKSDRAKPFKGFGNAAVLEIVENNIGGTYRAVYTVKFKEVIAVLHVFQKKSKQGIATPKPDVDLIKNRFKQAEQAYEAWLLNKENHESQNK